MKSFAFGAAAMAVAGASAIVMLTASLAHAGGECRQYVGHDRALCRQIKRQVKHDVRQIERGVREHQIRRGVHQGLRDLTCRIHGCW